MRAALYVLISGILLSLVACNSGLDKIPGTYVYETESTSSKAWDTVELSNDAAAGSNAFTMIYKIKSQRKESDGKLGEPTYTRDTLTIVYNIREHTLQVQEWLQTVPVDLKAGTLLFGESLFKKIQ